MMRYLLLLFLLGFGLELLAQQRLVLKINAKGETYSTDTNILVKEFKNGLAPFMIKNKDPFTWEKNRVGFIDSTGNIKVKPVYINCSPFFKGRALVQDTSGKANIIDTLGNFIFPVFYDWIARCSNGLFFVWKNQKIGLFTASGQEIFPPKRYSNFATPPPVYLQGKDYGPHIFEWRMFSLADAVQFTDFIAVKYNGLWGVINRNGVEIIPPKFESIGLFVDGLAIAVKNKREGVIDIKGNWLIPPVYDKAVITPYKAILINNRKKWGAITIKNKVVVPVIYDGVNQLTKNTFLVHKEKEENSSVYGVVNDKKKVIIPLDDQGIDAFGDGFIISRMSYINGAQLRCALYDSHVKQISSFAERYDLREPLLVLHDHYDSLQYFVFNKIKNRLIAYNKIIDYPASDIKDIARFICYKRDNRWGLLDANGAEITQPVYDGVKITAWDWLNPSAFVKQNGKWGAIDRKGNILLRFEYDDCGYLKQGCNWLKKGDRYGLILHDLKHITSFIYDKPKGYYDDEYYDKTGIIPVQENGKWGFLNNKGQKLISCIYDEFLYPNGYGDDIMPVRIDNKWGFLDKYLKPTTPIQYDKPRQVSHYEMRGKVLFSVTQNHKYGLVDTGGHQIVPCIYDEIMLSRRGAFISKKEQMYGLLCPDGSVLVDPEYRWIGILDSNFDQGHTWYRVSKNKLVGLIDEGANIVIPCQYNDLKLDQIGEFVAQKNGRWGIISLKNEVIVPFRYKEIGNIPLQPKKR